jgi:hypothetical protein
MCEALDSGEMERGQAYFLQQSGGATTSTLSLEVEHGGLTGRKARKLSSSKIIWALQLIITAIFGDAISFIIKLASG